MAWAPCPGPRPWPRALGPGPGPWALGPGPGPWALGPGPCWPPAPGVAALWGREKIRELMDDMRTAGTMTDPGAANDARDAFRQQIIDTALSLNLISKFTSLVAVDKEPGRPAGVPLAEGQVPVNLPAGWDRDAIEGTPNGPVPAPAPTLRKTMAPTAPGRAATLAFNRTDPAVTAHLAAAVSGTPLAAAPQTATPAHAYMGLGVLFVIAALAILTLSWRGPRPRRRRSDTGEAD